MTKKAHVLNPQEFKRLMSVVKDSSHSKRDTLLMLMSYGLGLRAIELSHLRVDDVLNPDGSIIESVLLNKTKGEGKRTFYLIDKKIKEALIEYIKERMNKKEVFSHSQPLFLSQKRGPFNNLTLAKRFNNLYKLAGIKGASSHSGRRTFATNLIEKGMDIKSVSVLMGHSNIQMTAEYVQENPERLKRTTLEALY